MKIFYSTFGCKVNSYETAALRQLMEQRGHESAESASAADCLVVNSCAVTSSGESRSVRAIAAARRENPNIITVLCGCVPQAFPEKYSSRQDIDIIAGNASRSELPELIERFAGERLRQVRPHSAEEGFELLPFSAMPGHTRAFLKVEDGCDRFCAYCIIPYARGRVRSSTPESISSRCKELAAGGYREVVLCGINLSKYGSDLGLNLADAVDAAAVEGIERIRLGSLEPDLMTREMLQRMAAQPRLCPQFHLALQSGCDRTLAAMNRRYTTRQYLEAAELIRSCFPDAVFTTDVMVGFPGETEEDFRQSLQFVEDFGFLKCHIFPYSVRSGTAAASLPGQLERAEKQGRAKLMAEAAASARRKLLESFAGREAQVLIEQPSGGRLTGYTRHYIPCSLPLDAGRCGEIVTCRLLPPKGDVCPAQPVE